MLTVDELSIGLVGRRGHTIPVVDKAWLRIGAGATLGLVGESGSGKSMLCRSLVGTLHRHSAAVTGGSILFEGEELVGASEATWRRIRGHRIAYVPQSSLAGINPVLTVGTQLTALVRAARSDGGASTSPRARVRELLDLVEIPRIDSVMNERPHQLSGGMRQRVVIAGALARSPSLLIADEPTTALDVRVQARILDLLRRLREQLGMSLVLVSHDLAVVEEVCDSIVVLYAGAGHGIGTARHTPRAVPAPLHGGTCRRRPHGARRRLRTDPGRGAQRRGLAVGLPVPPPLRAHLEAGRGCGTQPLLHGTPAAARRVRRTAHRLPVRIGHGGGGSTTGRVAGGRRGVSVTGTEAGLAGRGVRVTFGRGHGAFNAVDAADINVREREVVGLVGESGSGKTTLGKVLALLQRPTLGEVSYRGEPLEMPRRNNRSEMRGHIQMIFQDPYSSLNPKQRALHAVAEVFQVWRGSSRSVALGAAMSLLGEVGISEEQARLYPASLSGGQRQRVSVARALAVEPRILIADEPNVFHRPVGAGAVAGAARATAGGARAGDPADHARPAARAQLRRPRVRHAPR